MINGIILHFRNIGTRGEKILYANSHLPLTTSLFYYVLIRGKRTEHIDIQKEAA
jgi:uncharacterized protein YijF (DUF1287 family)